MADVPTERSVDAIDPEPRSHRALGGFAAAILVVAACIEPGQDVRSAAPTGSLTPAASASASTGAGAYSRGDNGAPLYYFKSDAKAGDTNGQGVGGSWFVAAR